MQITSVVMSISVDSTATVRYLRSTGNNSPAIKRTNEPSVLVVVDLGHALELGLESCHAVVIAQERMYISRLVSSRRCRYIYLCVCAPCCRLGVMRRCR